MNQLSNIVVDFARYRRVRAPVRGLTALDLGGVRCRGALLSCRWERDTDTARLICVWAAQKGAREAEPPSRRSLAA
jgi:hypothetical protein